jgi:hypothetical protein
MATAFLRSLREPGREWPDLVDRRDERLELPPFAVLGAGCNRQTEGRIWRLAFQLFFYRRPPAVRPIYRDEVGQTFKEAVNGLRLYYRGGAVTKIEIWAARLLVDIQTPSRKDG